MTNKNAILITAVFLLVGSIYFYLYRDWFRQGDIQIFHTIRPKPAGRSHRGPAAPSADPSPNVLSFGMAHDYKLTSIKVVPLSDLNTNKYPHPIWELVSESNSAPARAFSYGTPIKGMHPRVKGAEPDILVPDVDYRLLVEAGSLKGQHDFKIPGDKFAEQ
jgi:hypothetical protein